MAKKAEIDAYYEFMYPLAIHAGELLLEGYQKTGKRVKTKSELYDVVTEYDSKIEDYLIEQITAKYPDHKFIGEEETAKNNVTKELTDAPTWIIDPIDGTANFIKQIPHTCVSIGLSVGKKIVLGIVNNSVQNKMYTAKLGQGAFCNGQPIRVSNTTRLNEAHMACEVGMLMVPQIRNKHIKRIYHLGAHVRSFLSYACIVDSLCLVAAGHLDAFHIEDMYPWDCAAGSLLVLEAGGVLTHPYGGEFDIMKPDLICAASEELRKDIEQLIRKADSSQSVGGSEL